MVKYVQTIATKNMWYTIEKSEKHRGSWGAALLHTDFNCNINQCKNHYIVLSQSILIKLLPGDPHYGKPAYARATLITELLVWMKRWDIS